MVVFKQCFVCVLSDDIEFIQVITANTHCINISLPLENWFVLEI